MTTLWIVLALIVAGSVSVVVGLWLLAGLGWALLALGLLLFGAAGVLRRGLVNV